MSHCLVTRSACRYRRLVLPSSILRLHQVAAPRRRFGTAIVFRSVASPFLSYADKSPVCFRSLSSDSSSLPYHLVVGMPALSPTMTAGTISEWYVTAGDSFKAGDVLCKIETDKATIDFEAQDDGVVAKLLVPAGDGVDRVIGEPILITVEDSADVTAFVDYVAAETAPIPPPAPVAVAPTVEMPSAPAAPVIPVAPPPPPVVAAAPPPPPPPLPKPATASLPPLLNLLRKEQQEYIQLYGTTGQHPI
jgi:pyruvate dehydrogenase E2 component (dihydrolipoamide acetyltransferase)